MKKNYLLVYCMKALDIQDFVQNIVCRENGWKVQKVQKTLFMNIYNVELLIRDSIFPKRRIVKSIEFVAYDTYFEFGDLNLDGKFNWWWLSFQLVRCIKFSKDYLPTGDVECYKLEIYKFLKKENLFFISDCFFYKKSANKSLIFKIEREDVNSRLAECAEIYLSGIVFDPEFYSNEEIINSKEIVHFEYPLVIDKEGKHYILANMSDII